MKLIRRNREIGSVKLLTVIGVVLLAVVFSLFHWSDGKVIKRKHAALITAIEKRSQKKLMKIMSDDYSDRWGFTKEEASLAWREAGMQFLVLVVSAEEPQIEMENDEAEISTTLRVGGKAIGPIGQEVVRRANKLDTPWIFTWRKEGFGPGGWKLVRMENESIPDDAYGYTPGAIKRALDGEGF